MSLCDYCGDDLVEADTCVIGEKQFHRNCLEHHIPKRDTVLSKIKDFIPIRNHVLSMGIHVRYLYGPGKDKKKAKKGKKDKRINKQHELLRKVTALRNSGSGAVLVHLVGLESDDTYTGYFDEFADEKLNGIIHDGKLFFDVYKKRLLRDCEYFQEYTDFLLLFVEGASYLTTYDFNTKVSLDDRIIDASETNVRRFLKRRRQFQTDYHKLDDVTCSHDLLKKQESSVLQMKSNHPESDNTSEEKIEGSVFEKLKLPQYISAFTKNDTGGSFIFGITENIVNRRWYQTKENREQPVIFSDFEQLRNSIKTSSKSVLVCDYSGKVVTPDPDIVQVKFIPSEDKPQEGVIQVAVRPVRGIVFFKEGPLAYKYNDTDKSVSKLHISDWFRLFSRRNEHVDC